MRSFLQSLLGWAVVVVCGIGLYLSFFTDLLGLQEPEQVRQQEATLAPVAVLTVPQEFVELEATYAGMLKPFERHALAFEFGGRILGFNADEGQTHLDEGDRVQKGQIIARLDDTEWQAHLAEIEALLDQAEADLDRAEKLKSRNISAISETELQRFRTDKRMYEAKLESAKKKLDDTILRSPVDGVIAQRWANPGTIIGPHAKIVEILELDRLLMTIGVPESRVQEIKLGAPARVEFLRPDLFQRPRELLSGEVYRIDQAADDTTGLFQVEILLPNEQRRFRPGVIGKAHVLIHREEGFRLPMECLIRQQGQQGFFVVQPSETGNTSHFVPLRIWAERGSWLLVPAEEIPADLHHGELEIVVRGQHRLVEDTPVQIVSELSGEGE